jgi:putative transferase (TIGR04331 family)
MMTNKLLVTTALEETWGDAEEIIFLGEWCKTYGKRHVWGERSHETIPFHWDNRDKLKTDYDYLERLHHRLLKNLAVSLNDLHRVDYPKRYWQILLDPWLLSYVGVLFDRWECLRSAFDRYAEFKTVAIKEHADVLPPLSYSEFITQALSDEWNHAMYLRIIAYQYPTRCTITKGGKNLACEKQAENHETGGKPRQSFKARMFSGVEKILGRFCPRYGSVFIGSYFGLVPLIRLSLSLRQFPRLFSHDFKPSVESLNALLGAAEKSLDRTVINFNFQPQTDFEDFLGKSLRFDMPLCVVEGYHPLRKQTACLSVKTKAIVTASSHWTDFVAKAWFAEQVAQGVKLVVLEHGGSFPAYKELFDFEEDISDVRGTWFLPYHPKHRQVPPSRLIGRFSKEFSAKRQSEGKYCSIIGNECPRYVHRAHFYPMASQCLESVKLVDQLYDGLLDDVKEYIRVKPAPGNDWDTRGIYADLLGENKIYPGISMDNVFAQSKLVICTYPETTFTEAMMSGVPTVMIYPEYYYERLPVAFPLLERLRAAKIIFHDSQAAATHLNAIWNDPDKWWLSPEIIAARKEFYRQACKLDPNWLKEWKIFLAEVRAWV